MSVTPCTTGTKGTYTYLLSSSFQLIEEKNGCDLICSTFNLFAGSLYKRPLNKSPAYGENPYKISTSVSVIRLRISIRDLFVI